jgi:tRNA dimethylallyltransferase
VVADELKLLAIVGPTASGKTGLSIDIAKQYHGEIIAADSRTVYKGLNIGTAKPSTAEQDGIAHWGFDLVGPNESFSVSDFKAYAEAKIADIRSRGNLPIIVGGTGLYIDALLYDFSLAPPNIGLRRELETLGILELQQRIKNEGLVLPENIQNRRHLVRVLERGTSIVSKKRLPSSTVIVGLNPPKDILADRISKRADQMLTDGVMDEITWAFDTYSLDSEALTGGIYRVFRDVIWGDLPKEKAIELVLKSDMQLAKRQATWFKRNPDITWFSDTATALSWLNQTFGGTLK